MKVSGQPIPCLQFTLAVYAAVHGRIHYQCRLLVTSGNFTVSTSSGLYIYVNKYYYQRSDVLSVSSFISLRVMEHGTDVVTCSYISSCIVLVSNGNETEITGCINDHKCLNIVT